MRKPAEWMHTIDNRILEVLCNHGNHTPRALSEDADTVRLDKSSSYVGRRLRTLADYGLVERIDKGLYGITDEGRAYLNEELDASELGNSQNAGDAPGS